MTEFDHISVIGNSYCACVMSREWRDLLPGSKNGPHFWNPWSKFTTHFAAL